jgi:hypothetical protein
VNQDAVIFDVALYSPVSIGWKQEIAGHEWGHVLSLNEHTGSICSDAYIMQRPDQVTGAACALTPRPSETCSAWSAYAYTTNTDATLGDTLIDGCDLDDDGDNCTDAREIANQGIKEPDNPLDRRDFPDFDADGKVDFDDFEFFASVLFTNNPFADLDDDGYVDFDDFEIFVAAWLRTCP